MSEIADHDLQEIFNDPARVYNSDESNIQLCPKTGKVLGIKGHKNIYEVAPGPEKSTLTFLGTFNARGDIVCPAIIYPYVRMPKDIIDNVPDNFFIGQSESGWMKSETFFEFIANGFVPWLSINNITKPVILFVDGHKTHLTMQLSKYCDENGVVLYLLPPNTTHILQPADVGVFVPMKDMWRKQVHRFQRQNVNEPIRRKDVAPMLKEVLDQISVPTNAFRATGLYPLNPDDVDYSKIINLPKNPVITNANSVRRRSINAQK